MYCKPPLATFSKTEEAPASQHQATKAKSLTGGQTTLDSSVKSAEQTLLMRRAYAEARSCILTVCVHRNENGSAASV